MTTTNHNVAVQHVDEGVTVNKKALETIHEVANTHSQGESGTLQDALKATGFAISEGIVKTHVCVPEEYLSVVLEVVKDHLGSDIELEMEGGVRKTDQLQQAIKNVERSVDGDVDMVW